MNACEAMIDIELGTNETRAQKFARNAGELLSDKAVIVTCPDCEGLRYHERDCSCSPNPNGCSECRHTGRIGIPCQTCKKQGEVLMYADGRIEALI